MSLQKGCVLHMSLDEESYNPATRRFTDKSAYGNHGISDIAANFTADRMGQTTRAMAFNGVDDCVEMNDHIPNGEYTISAWFNSTNAGDLGMFNFAALAAFNFNYVGDGRPILILGSSNYKFFDDCTGYMDGKWHLLSLYIAGAEQGDIVDCALRIDGEIIPLSFTDSGLPQTSFTNLYIGSGYAYRPFDGNINDVRIYNRALTESERTYLYESYRPKLMVGP